MDRLTFVDGVGMNEIKRCFDCGESQAGSNNENCGMCEHFQKVLDRLAEYEDTGLEPEECRWVPIPGGDIYIFTHDCDNCPWDEKEAYMYCFNCKQVGVVKEKFVPVEHLEAWYSGNACRTREEALKQTDEARCAFDE